MTYTRHEGSFEGFDQNRLFYQSWTQPHPKARIVLTHGQGEHSDCYGRLIQYFESKNIDFYSYDLRGHGKSEGLRGYAADFHDYVKDTLIFYDLIRKKVGTKVPLIALGHSMGGLIQTLALLEGEQNKFTSQILSAPLFGVAVKVPVIKDKAARWLHQLMPKLTLGNEIDYSMLSRDPDVIREYEKDYLRHNRISSGVYLGFTREFETVAQRAQEIQLPTMMVVAERDPVIDSLACENFFEKISSTNKRIRIYGQESKHELFNDTVRKDVFSDVELFLKEQTEVENANSIS
ncbi:MAG: lysophospholipase [Bdellovibrionales bacterium]